MIPEIDNEDIEYFIERNENYFAASIIAGGFCSDANVLKYLSLSKAVGLLHRKHDIFLLKSSFQDVVAELKDKVRTKNYVKNIVDKCHQTGESLISTAQRIGEKSKKKLTKKEMIKLLNEFYTKAFDYCAFYEIAIFQKPMTELAHEIIEKYSANEDSFKTITSPSRITESDKEQDDFLRILTFKKEDHEKLATQHAKRYGWLSVRYFNGNPWTKEDILERINQADVTTAKEILDVRLKERREMDEKVADFCSKLEPKDQETVHLIREIVYLRTRRAEYMDQSAVPVLPLLHQICDYLKLDFEDMLNCHTREIIQSLEEGIDLSERIKERKEDIIIFPTHDCIAISGDEAKEYVKNHPNLERKFEDSNIVKGNPAFKGKVSGKVRIVMNNDDLSKVKSGDVLVAVMTFPSFIAAMEKASAFVTDEGGILCHAAIVSREMKKPCIIATKKATRVFNDGDMVEVNADTGVVKKL